MGEERGATAPMGSVRKVGGWDVQTMLVCWWRGEVFECVCVWGGGGGVDLGIRLT